MQLSLISFKKTLHLKAERQWLFQAADFTATLAVKLTFLHIDIVIYWGKPTELKMCNYNIYFESFKNPRHSYMLYFYLSL